MKSKVSYYENYYNLYWVFNVNLNSPNKKQFIIIIRMLFLYWIWNKYIFKI